MRSAIVALFLAFFGISAASAQVYDYRKGKVKMDVSGQQVEIRYLWVPPGTAAKLGTLVFEGGVSERSGKIEGTAYVLTKQCRPVPYQVTGDFVGGDKQLVLSGYVPAVNIRTCEVARDDNCTERHVFTIDSDPY